MDTDSLIETLGAEGARKPMPGLARQAGLWLAGTLAWIDAIVWWKGMRPDLLDKIAQPLFLCELAILFLLALSLAIRAFALSRPDGKQLSGVVSGIPVGLFAAWSWIATAMMDHGPAPAIMPFDPRQFDCVLCILMLCLPPGIATFMAVRTGAPTKAFTAGWLCAACATVSAYLAMRLIEPNDSPVHLMLWHAGPVLILCLAGMIAGKLFLRWK